MNLTGKRYMTPEERFWPRVDKTETCWLWTGARSSYRYGNMMVDGRQIPVHRWAYEQFVGPIPEGHQIDHICGVTLCVRPDHLRPLTAAENVRAHWREQRGTCRNGHPMTEDNIVWRLGGRKRECRACSRDRRARYRARQRHERLPS